MSTTTISHPAIFTWGKRLVRLVCSYELLALPERSPLPTITTLTHANRHKATTKALVWALLGTLTFHLLFEADSRFTIDIVNGRV